MALLDQFIQSKGQLTQQAGQEAEQARFLETSNLRSTGIGALEALNRSGDDRTQFLMSRVAEIESRGGDPRDTQELLSLDPEGQERALQGVVQIAQQAGALGTLASEQPRKSQKGASFITKGKDDKLFVNTPVFDPFSGTSKINKVAVTDSLVSKLGETGDEQTIRIINEAKGKTKATEESKASVKAGEEVSQDIIKVDKSISNIDRAIDALDKGARTGAVQRFLPSVKSASVELDNIRNSMGLDIIGAAAFGALSESELEFALSTAIPTGLNEAALKDFLIRKREVQQKAREALANAAREFSQGKTRAQLLTSQEAAKTPSGQSFTSSAGVKFTVE
jgi:hypothetical protein